jgi:hypothetical protein
MASILTQVDGNAVCASQFALHRCPDRIRLIGHPGLPDRCDVVDIDI